MAENKKDRRGLGRGLSALMADVGSGESSASAGSSRLEAERAIPIEKIHPNADQPRREFDERQLGELTASIREKGVIQPLILREHPEKATEYQIVAGERRWRAAQMAGLHEVPAITREYTDTELLEIAIIENIQRAELNSIEEASGYRQLMDRFGHTQEKISEALGKSRSHIANLLRLLNLPEEVQDFVRDGKLTSGHARALVTSEDPLFLAQKIIKDGLSVRDAEALTKAPIEKNPKPKKTPAIKDADTRALENDLSAATGLKVQIDHAKDGESGRISIDYKTLDDLDRVCAQLSAIR